ncbi:MAG TPA: precorrin-6y C5,15-methyltransferase (decarboxylating) subunit CbiE, partial [Arenibaculum sp.]|nr:precorrin-6y C5,15-methyltransferase (decarboxylating) subunit CbiE [Arenibaculum sp.]
MRWLSVVGIGEDGLDGLPPAARLLVEQADVLVGGERHLAMVPEQRCERLSWPSPLAALVDAIVDRRGRQVCVLGTGDPMWYGIGVTLARRVPVEEMTVIPAPGAFSLACARLGWPLARVETLTLHGRPVELLHPCIL